jgi:hypothetical protein
LLHPNFLGFYQDAILELISGTCKKKKKKENTALNAKILFRQISTAIIMTSTGTKTASLVDSS